MALQTKYTIYIGGQNIPVIADFRLYEKMGNHTSFSLTVRADILESRSENTIILDESKEFLNEIFSIQIQAVNGFGEYKPLEFKGIITSVENIKGFHQSSGDLILLEGMGSSIILEDGADYKSFIDKPISGIISDALGIYNQSSLKVAIAPEQDNTLLYSVMNGESRFRYLRRLAITQGEFFFYHRDTLYFGKPDMGEEIPLIYGTDLMSFKLGMKPVSARYNYFAHQYHTEEEITSSTTNVSSNARGYTTYATGVANNLFHNETRILHHSYDEKNKKQRMDRLVKLQKKVLEQQQVMLSGSSNNTEVSLGKIIKIQNEKGSFGKFRVIEVEHSTQNGGAYINKFNAISMEVDVSPITNIDMFSSSQPAIAKVVDTNDPDKLSRVKIQYPFDQERNVTSPWIRVATPYAGSDYGLHAIPEKGSSVIVGYHAGNIEQPYVMSSLYTGIQKHTGWQSENNDFKGWSTKGGAKIELNDTKDGEMITITDKNQNVIQFDTVGKTIRISAPENIEISAKNVSITAEENITIEAEENVEIAAQKDLNALADGNLALQSSGDMTAKSKASLAMEAIRDISAKGMNAIIEGKTSAEMNGAQTKVTGKTLTEVSAGIVKIN